MVQRMCRVCGEQRYFFDDHQRECHICRTEREEGEMNSFVEELKETLTLEERVERLEKLLYQQGSLLDNSAKHIFF